MYIFFIRYIAYFLYLETLDSTSALHLEAVLWKSKIINKKQKKKKEKKKKQKNEMALNRPWKQ